MNNATHFLVHVTALLFVGTRALAAPHTPAVGSEERKAICDAVRDKVTAQAFRRLPQAIVFKIEFLRVDDGYAWFEATPRFKDGSFVSTEFLADIDYIFVLRKTSNGWRVKEDLSRSDVPSPAEAAQIRARLREIPASIVPDSWRTTLNQ